MQDKKLIVFTDLDGTLLDARTYSFEPAAKALGLLEERGVPLVICTSKTRPEILYWRERLENRHPFIAENGGGVYIPAEYFKAAVPSAKVREGYSVIEFGTPYPELRKALAALRDAGFDVRGFGDMTPEEVSILTGLTVDEAALAKEREFDEPFVYGGENESMPRLFKAIGRAGLRHTSGRLMHILGDNDKGRAVKYLSGLYREEHEGVVTAALGDSPNDAPMLAVADYPFLVKKPEGHHDPNVNDGRVVRVDGVGPEGWAEAVEGLLMRLKLV